MPNLLPPQPGGVLAAIGACPEADVIFVAHAGLDGLVTLGDVWRDLPIDQTVRAQWWRVPFDQVPRSAGHEAQVKWLYDWWQRIDAWITEHRPADAPGTAEPDTPAAATPSLDRPSGHGVQVTGGAVSRAQGYHRGPAGRTGHGTLGDAAGHLRVRAGPADTVRE